MEVIQVTDYDILADEMPDQSFVVTREYKKHIGNMRFLVLLELYQEAFEMCYMQQKDDDCKKIVQRIIDVTTHKDVSIQVTKGRYLVKKNGEGKWIELDDEKANKFVHQVLSNPEEEDVELEEEIPEAEVVPSKAVGSMSINDDHKKRRRRSSLLRRSVSETGFLTDDKKKTYRGLQGIEDPDADEEDNASHMSAATTASEPVVRRVHSSAIPTKMTSIGPASLARHQSVPIPSSNGGLIGSPKGMDVVLAENCKNLSTTQGIVGNNRLHVMLTLQGSKYNSLNHNEQEKAAKDLVRAVCQYWGGRMLVQQGISYRKLNDEEALVAMKALLSAQAEGELASPPMPSFTPSSVTSGGGSPGPKPLLSAPQPPAFLKNASMELLSVGGTGNGPCMQSEAVKSLQQRKAKRQIAKNLGTGRSIPDNFPEFSGPPPPI